MSRNGDLGLCFSSNFVSFCENAKIVSFGGEFLVLCCCFFPLLPYFSLTISPLMLLS